MKTEKGIRRGKTWRKEGGEKGKEVEESLEVM